MQTSVRVSAALLEELGEAGIAKSRNAALSLAVERYLADIAAKERIGQRAELGGPLETVSLRLGDADFQQLKRRTARGNTSLGAEVAKAAGHVLWLRGRFGPALTPMQTNFSFAEVTEAWRQLCDAWIERYVPKGWPYRSATTQDVPPTKWEIEKFKMTPEEIAKGHPRTRSGWVEPPPCPGYAQALEALRSGEIVVDVPETVYLDADQRRVYPYKVTNG